MFNIASHAPVRQRASKPTAKAVGDNRSSIRYGGGSGLRTRDHPLTEAPHLLLRLSLESALLILVSASVALTHILIPRLGLNAAPGDIVNAILVAAGIVWLWRARVPFQLPLGASVSLIVVGGLLALPGSIDPATSVFAIAQDVYLYLWFLVLTIVMRSKGGRGAELAARVWISVGVLAALLASLAPLAHPQYVSSILGSPTVDDIGRSITTFRNPNLAASFFSVSVFVLWASPSPATRIVKSLFTVPFVLALLATSSSGALGAVAAGTVMALACAILRRLRIRVAVMLALFAGALVCVALVSEMSLRSPERILGPLARSQVFSRSLGRLDDSANDRRQRWNQGIYLLGGRVALGVGPGAAPQTLTALSAPMTGELHNDYLAGFLERGILGGLGVVMLCLATLRLATPSNRGPRWASAWGGEALVGGMVVIWISAITLEALHLRHVWLFFALVASLSADDLRAHGRR